MSTVVCSPVPKGAGEHPRLRRVVGGVLALLAALGAVLAAPARPAYAHAQLVGTSPVNGERLATAPPEIVLRFSEPVNLLRDGIRLLGPAGAVAGVGPARVDPAEPAQVRVPMPATLADGVYTVAWRVVSIDSHPIHGAFVFGLGNVEVVPLAESGAQTDADPALSAVFWLFRWLGYGALALLIGTACFLVLCWPPGWGQRRVRRVLVAGWAASGSCAVAVLLLQGPYAAGGSLAQIGDADLLATTLGADYGRSVGLRLGLLALGGGLLLGAARTATPVSGEARTGNRTTALRAAAAGVLATLPATWVGTGHANGKLLAGAADTLHVLAMAVWFGGLIVMLSCVLPRSAARDTPEVAGAVNRFSRLATACVVVLVATGTYQAWRGVGSIEAVSGSTYGILLVFKLGAVCVLLWLGWMSRSLVRRRFRILASDPSAAPANRSGRRAARARGQQALLSRQQLRWSVGCEVSIAVAVIAVTSMLVATPPGARPEAGAAVAAAAPAGEPVAASAELALDDGGRVDVRFEPAGVGPGSLTRYSLTLAVRRADGTAWDVPEVTAALRLPEQDLGPLPVTLVETAPGEYGAAEVTVPIAGTWRLRVKVRTSEIDLTTVETPLVIA